MASIKERYSAVNNRQIEELRAILNDIRLDLAELRSVVNSHVHGGVTSGGANSGAPTTTVGALRTVE